MSRPKFLIDENLSPALAEVANGRGFVAGHVSHMGMGGWKDWELVTKNAVEFRRRYAGNTPKVVRELDHREHLSSAEEMT